MNGTIPPVREIVIVISDLYLALGQADRPPSADALGSLPGFEYAARFGQRRSIEGEGGWRPWLARWLGRDDVASVAPAVIAAAALAQPRISEPSASTQAATPSLDSTATPPAAVAAALSLDSTAWFATPVHLIAGLTSLHLDRRSILRLSPADLEHFAQDFNQTFGDSGLHLLPLPAGDFLMQGPATLIAATMEPARALVVDLETALPKGSDSKALKRLGAELEMWLHAHPLNEARRRRRELPVSTLWLWGGGTAPPRRAHETLFTPRPELSATHSPNTDLAFGSDPYLAGLWSQYGSHSRALPDRLSDLLQDSNVQRAILVTEITPLLHSNPHWTVFEALGEIDRRWVAPVIAAIREGAVAGAVFIANDTELRVRRRDHLRFWRRPQPGLTGLQVTEAPK
jgi:hypothetical protein